MEKNKFLLKKQEEALMKKIVLIVLAVAIVATVGYLFIRSRTGRDAPEPAAAVPDAQPTPCLLSVLECAALLDPSLMNEGSFGGGVPEQAEPAGSGGYVIAPTLAWQGTPMSGEEWEFTILYPAANCVEVTISLEKLSNRVFSAQTNQYFKYTFDSAGEYMVFVQCLVNGQPTGPNGVTNIHVQ